MYYYYTVVCVILLSRVFYISSDTPGIIVVGSRYIRVELSIFLYRESSYVPVVTVPRRRFVLGAYYIA